MVGAERGGLAALVAAVEHRAIDELALVFHLHLRGVGGYHAGALREHAVLQSVGQHLYALGLCIALQPFDVVEAIVFLLVVSLLLHNLLRRVGREGRRLFEQHLREGGLEGGEVEISGVGLTRSVLVETRKALAVHLSNAQAGGKGKVFLDFLFRILGIQAFHGLRDIERVNALALDKVVAQALALHHAERITERLAVDGFVRVLGHFGHCGFLLSGTCRNGGGASHCGQADDKNSFKFHVFIAEFYLIPTSVTLKIRAE